MLDWVPSAPYTAEQLLEVLRILRDPENGCPWDKVQTHESLREAMLEEAYEAVDAIDRKDHANLCEELGDVLFQVALHSVIAEEEGLFTVEDVIRDVSSKMKFRHPKIFSPEDKQLAGLSWEELKQLEKATEEEPEKAEKP